MPVALEISLMASVAIIVMLIFMHVLKKINERRDRDLKELTKNYKCLCDYNAKNPSNPSTGRCAKHRTDWI